MLNWLSASVSNSPAPPARVGENVETSILFSDGRNFMIRSQPSPPLIRSW